MSKSWFLGPAGDYRELPCPEAGFDLTILRYGGVHRGLSGASTVDVLGHRQQFTFNFDFLTAEEVQWMEALHLRIVPGPLFLISPMRLNRFSVSTSNCRFGKGTQPGIIFSDGEASYITDAPTAVPNLRTCVEWVDWLDGSTGEFDKFQPVPVTPGETITMSVYARTPSVDRNVTLRITYKDASGNVLTPSTPATFGLTAAWSRPFKTDTPPAGAATATLTATLTGGTAGTAIRFAGAQSEVGSSATDWLIGGGAILVNVDQMSTLSPLFPYRDVTLTLLET